eukprot:CAMPEP_0173375598 /NCGR_PEP_ID=MMETSP1144-20121109/29715_1 /TAXON_ID=483371 /ORGANISM="non described non described, Strain CCMP2298" /LENGTH=102 /DNA_ID=CAMNT_0014328047 /DNA_START=695 /DNA_END=1000 /DNA_ORIENTATION=+
MPTVGGEGNSRCGGGGGKWNAPFLFIESIWGTSLENSSARGLRGSVSSTHPFKKGVCWALRESLNLGIRRLTCLLRPSTFSTLAGRDFECLSTNNCVSSRAN